MFANWITRPSSGAASLGALRQHIPLLDSVLQILECYLLLETGNNPKYWVRFRYGFFIDGIGKMFPQWSNVTD